MLERFFDRLTPLLGRFLLRCLGVGALLVVLDPLSPWMRALWRLMSDQMPFEAVADLVRIGSPFLVYSLAAMVLAGVARDNRPVAVAAGVGIAACLGALALHLRAPTLAVVLAACAAAPVVERLLARPGPQDNLRIIWRKRPPASLCGERALRMAEQFRPRGWLLGLHVHSGSPVYITDDAIAQGNLHVIGTLGMGKTQTLLFLCYQAMLKGWGVVYVDAKTHVRDVETFFSLAARAGRREDIYYFNPTKMDAHTMNPIAPLPGMTVTDIATQIVRLIGREPQVNVPSDRDFWVRADNKKVLHMVEAFLAAGRRFVIRDCYYYFVSEAARMLVLQEADRKKPGILQKAVAGLTAEKTKDHSGISDPLEPWIADPFDRCVNAYQPQIHLEEIFREGKLLYIGIPVKSAELGKMLIEQFHTIARLRQQEARHSRKHVLLILDEFGAYLTPAILVLLEQCRSADISIVLSHQSLSILRAVEGIDKTAFSKTITDTTAVAKVFFTLTNSDDAREAAEIMGKEKAKRITRQERPDGTTARSISEVDDYIIPTTWFSTPTPFQAAVKVASPQGHGHTLRPAIVWTPFIGDLPAADLPRRDGRDEPDTGWHLERIAQGAPPKSGKFTLGTPESRGISVATKKPKPRPMPAAPPPVGERLTGVVKVIHGNNRHQDYGFIATAKYGDFFIHKAVLRAIQPPLAEGEEVEFEAYEEKGKGWRAKEIRRLGTPPEAA